MSTLAPPLVLTLSHLKSWEQCRRQYFYKHHQGMRWPRNEHRFVLGKAVHKLMEYQARGLAIDHLLPHLDPDIAETTRQLVTHPLAQQSVIANEWAFHLPLSDEQPRVWWTGRVDRIVRQQTGHIALLDWKTGTAIPKNPAQAWQTRLYVVAAWLLRDSLQLGIDKPEQLRFLYVSYQRGQIRVVEIPCEQGQVERDIGLLRAAGEAMAKAVEFPLPSACPDQHCDYSRICGFGQPDGSQSKASLLTDDLTLPETIEALF